MSFFNYDYLDKEGELNMTRATYKGDDNSLTYNYCYSPLCAWIVDNFIPRWMSANLVSFSTL